METLQAKGYTGLEGVYAKNRQKLCKLVEDMPPSNGEHAPAPDVNMVHESDERIQELEAEIAKQTEEKNTILETYEKKIAGIETIIDSFGRCTSTLCIEKEQYSNRQELTNLLQSEGVQQYLSPAAIHNMELIVQQLQDNLTSLHNQREKLKTRDAKIASLETTVLKVRKDLEGLQQTMQNTQMVQDVQKGADAAALEELKTAREQLHQISQGGLTATLGQTLASLGGTPPVNANDVLDWSKVLDIMS
eukprot:300490-Rhodomonas_salina.2